MSRDPTPVNSLLERQDFAAMRAQLEFQSRLLQAARLALPENLRSHCVHCVARDDSLILYADSPAWACQLRYYGPHLRLAVEAASGCSYREIRVRNLLPTITGQVPRPRPTPPSAATVEHVRNCAESTTIPEIREAWKRLEQTLENARRKEQGQSERE